MVQRAGAVASSAADEMLADIRATDYGLSNSSFEWDLSKVAYEGLVRTFV
jgi:hypothetical protein